MGQTGREGKKILSFLFEKEDRNFFLFLPFTSYNPPGTSSF